MTISISAVNANVETGPGAMCTAEFVPAGYWVADNVFKVKFRVHSAELHTFSQADGIVSACDYFLWAIYSNLHR